MNTLTSAKPFLARSSFYSDLLADPDFPQHVLDSMIVYTFNFIGMNFFREDTVVEKFPCSLTFNLELRIEQLDYKIRIASYLGRKADLKNWFFKHTSFWSKFENENGQTKEDTMMCMACNIFTNLSRYYYFDQRSFSNFPALMIVNLDKIVVEDSYALEASFYSNDLAPVNKVSNWSLWKDQADKYSLMWA